MAMPVVLEIKLKAEPLQEFNLYRNLANAIRIGHLNMLPEEIASTSIQIMPYQIPIHKIMCGPPIKVS
jgi:hypothetical protein